MSPRGRHHLPRLALGFLLLNAATWVAPAAAGTVVVLRSRPLAPFDSVAAGFHGSFSGTIVDATVEGSDPAALERRLQRLRPEAVVAIGVRAALFARDRMPRTPLVHCMVPDPARYDLAGAWITGISADVTPAHELAALKRAAPDVGTVAVFVGPGRESDFLRPARAAAARLGMTLLEVEIRDLASLPERARDAMPRVDALWLPVDATVATAEGFRFLLDLSLLHRKPLMAFAEPLVRAGAFVTFAPDYGSIGERAAEVVRRIEAGERAGDIPVTALKRMRLVINLATARAIGRSVPPDAIGVAELIP